MKKKVAIMFWGIIGLVMLILLTYEIIFWFGTPVTVLNPDNDSYVTVDDVNIYYTVHGTDRGTERPAIILLHSGAWSSLEYDAVIAQLKDNFIVYAFDMPGFGKSDKPQTKYSLDYLSQTMSTAMSQLSIGPAHIVGASMGGTVALQMAANNPEQIQSLTLIDPLGFGNEINKAALWAQIPIVAEVVVFPNRPVFDYVVDEGLQWHENIHEDTRQKLFEVSKLPKASRAKLSILRTMISANHIAPDVITMVDDAARRTYQPVLILWGERDTYAPPTQREHAIELMPQTIAPELFSTGHFTHIEAPKQVANEITAFIQSGQK